MPEAYSLISFDVNSDNTANTVISAISGNAVFTAIANLTSNTSNTSNTAITAITINACITVIESVRQPDSTGQTYTRPGVGGA
ncbi:hypothetical protein [Cryobacterium sp. 5B3]|uniref:hypothetical protein n=1 Tax=Cryobacterium sp. 5B3 TaxID=3048586 RepID=UPI002AB5BAB9|nr:hypothetical protein [Cryobacterium sp. 5B3]MDY7544587.1 hypothetical protein [Cryobacterium sp. 5B3]MEB0275975.1 hypothetical protein [Cryobacterium sp. 5B3]